MSLTLVALVPAAGRSRRMGRPKLTLGLGNESVIQRVVQALERGGASTVVVVAPPIEEPGAADLANHARAEDAHVVHLPGPTADMRATVEFGLGAIAEHTPTPDGLILTPGDVPGLSAVLVRAVVRRFLASPDRIVVPEHEGRRGHPVAIPWPTALSIPDLPPGVGVNALLDAHTPGVVAVALEDPTAILDMDTPEDYRRWAARGHD